MSFLLILAAILSLPFLLLWGLLVLAKRADERAHTAWEEWVVAKEVTQ